MPTRTVVFDMDGTLVQSRAAAWEVFRETNREFDLGLSTPEEFFDLFRDNFFVALSRQVGEPERSRRVADHFLAALRERYTPDLIPGMADVVHALAGHYSLAVMSSNAMTAIRRTLEASGVAHCFAHVFSGDVETDKKASLHRILTDPSYATMRRCSPAYLELGQTGPNQIGPNQTGPNQIGQGPAAEEIVLVTDTVGDVREGVLAGIRVIGVAWGMHTADDLREAGAEFVALWPQEIVARLLPDGACRPGGCDCLSCEVPAALSRDISTRDVRTEAAAAGRLRRSRRPLPATAPALGCGCGCDGASPSNGASRSNTAIPKQDPYLAVALAIIAPATPP